MRPLRPLGEPRPGKKGMSLGEVAELSGVLSGGQPRALEAYVWTCVMAIKITAPFFNLIIRSLIASRKHRITIPWGQKPGCRYEPAPVTRICDPA